MRLRATRLTAIATAVRRALPVFNPASLFATGAPGLWYDLSLTDGTLFQDAAGTTPVTAVEQPVGLVLDKSKGLVLGPELVTQPLDLNSGWLKLTATVNSATTFSTTGAGGVVLPITPGKSYKISINGSTTAPSVSVLFRNPSGGTVTTVLTGLNGAAIGNASSNESQLYVRNSDSGTTTITAISVRELPGNHAYQTTSANRPVLSARYNQFVGTETLATQSLTTLAATYLLRFGGTGSITLSGTATGTYTAGVYSVTCTAGTLTATVSGSVTKADLRVANDGINLPPYQAVRTATDYDTVGFPLYLLFNGSTQFLQTNSIDFSSTDKVLVAAGVRKLSDATAAVAAELSNIYTNAGAFAIFSPAAPGSKSYTIAMTGTLSAITASLALYGSPTTNILTCLGDISGDRATLRINGAQVSQSTADQGPGNYGNYPLFIGARAGTSLFFNGRLYSLIVAGIKPTDAQILGVETYINSLTKAF